jgi:hypothetical protein
VGAAAAVAVGAAAAVHSLGRCSHGRSLDLGPNLADRRTLAVAAGAVGPAPAPAGRTSAAAGARAWTAVPFASVARASGDLAPPLASAVGGRSRRLGRHSRRRRPVPAISVRTCFNCSSAFGGGGGGMGAPVRHPFWERGCRCYGQRETSQPPQKTALRDKIGGQWSPATNRSNEMPDAAQ